MSNVELPTWLAATFAGLALVAPSVAALVQGRFVVRRDDRRWERDRQIEAERLIREQERETVARHAELREQRRDLLYGLYRRIIALAQQWSETFNELGEAVETDTWLPSGRTLADMRVEFYGLQAELHIIGSEFMQNRVDQLVEAFGEALGELDEHSAPTNWKHRAELITGISELARSELEPEYRP